MRYILFIVVYLMTLSLSNAQVKGSENSTKKIEATKKTKKSKKNKMEIISSTKSKSYTGIILEKPWTKSTQSYCAQGSEYFVLKVQDEEWVIDNKSGVDLKKYHEKTVTITGFEQTRKIPKPQDPFSQYPVTNSFRMVDGKMVEVEDTDFTCTVLVIEKF